MAKDEWVEYSPSSQDKWEEYTPQEEKASPIASAIRGLGQSVSFGHMPQILGGIESLTTPQTYEQARDKYKNIYEKSAQQNPTASTVGEIAGMLPGGVEKLGSEAILKGAKYLPKIAEQASKLKPAAASFLKNIYSGGAQSGIRTGLTSGSDAGDTAESAGVGAGFSAIMGAGGKALSLIPAAAKKSLTGFFGTPQKTIETYLKNPQAVENAPSARQISDNLSGIVSELKNQVVNGSLSGREELAKSGIGVKSDILKSVIDKHISEVTKHGVKSSDAPALAELQKLKDGIDVNLKSQNGVIPIQNVKTLLSDLDDIVNYQTQPGQFSSTLERAASGARKEIDKGIKDIVPAYGKKMEEISPQASLLQDLKSGFKSDESRDRLIKNIGMGKKERYAESIKDLDKLLGENRGSKFLEDLENSRAREDLLTPKPMGSKRTLLGGAVGGGVGSLLGTVMAPGLGTTIGAGIGAAAGTQLDPYGGMMVKKIIDASGGLEKMIQKVKDTVPESIKPALLKMGELAKTSPDALKKFVANYVSLGGGQ